MFPRAAFVCGLLACLVSAAFADVITFTDGTQKTVRLYKQTKEYLSYLFEGKIEVVARDKVKDRKPEGEALTEAELAEALKKSREELKKKVEQEEKESGLKPGKSTEVQSVVDPKGPLKGVKVIDKDKSKTKATELMIDPFPDHPVKDKPPARTEGKEAEEPAEKKAQD